MLSEEPWKLLEKAYGERGIFLALGSGVSVGCGLPAWDQLLERISYRCYGENGPALVKEMIEGGYSYPVIASILEADSPKGTDFTECIRDALYEKFPYYRKSTKGRYSAEFVDFVREKNPTLSAVAALCAMKQEPEVTFARNPSIHGIVNFNFDAILREYTRERYRPTILRTVERPSAEANPGRINVYHVHGFFQFLEDLIGEPEEEAPDIRVFTEQEYFDFFNQPNTMFSYAFLYLLRTYRMLFIGISFKDDNVRRLLHYSQKEIRESYEKEYEKKTERSDRLDEVGIRHYTIQKSTQDDGRDRIIETSLRRLGVLVLWVEDFASVPEKLQQLYESTGSKWSDVY